MKNPVYVLICETEFTEERDGHKGEYWIDAVYENRDDAVKFINEEFSENKGPDESGNRYEFVLNRPIVSTKEEKAIAKEGDTMMFYIAKSEFVKKTES